ncbi:MULTISPECIES: 3'(2'),5'-bisphosphate nucleotidase CysQ [unclassified Devosia]|uniref:3'(2'),5'-bisphosphate nucleotidase CysQ n=1 Tax=unclassified Devosia TaxID=196773 RepID=UPI00145F2871|nr:MULTISPECIES: 3'(2'),5'-bisphosphate nucleotidase CysQ [unclassified Devosia]MBJ6988290.1 3'(2'),5'-bisphosphate nucleotidase CysQ [Devosia sp. MC521]MBJ7577544.1 3'(2'),5'-bisphosphate nucleotidase CysQ [Devosia sp. MC532]MBK1794547.1 3'(2'),5'-bisphosphate nucleotidase CysQ [Devosia sp. WQ 349K1]QMW63201.1 3'(2'),5'-bisphosphate nucleotidase CysQ [Devosia sp. MC521]
MPAYSRSYSDDLELLRSTAVAAGLIASSFFRRDIKTWTKENSSPVSEADIMVDRFLAANLLQARPDYGWLSEETVDNPSRLDSARCFVVDPIDGTRAFLRGEEYWTISIAVVEHGVPVAGVVYAPALDEMYDAVKGGGARMNARPLQRSRRAGALPMIPAPGAVHQEIQATGLDYTRGPAYPSLAYRLVQVATGRLDAAVSRRGSQDWDIAAAALILSEAGMDFADVCLGYPQFNKRDVRHGALAALSDISLKPVIHAALIKVYGCPEPQGCETDQQPT